jgi:hypothetical protein
MPLALASIVSTCGALLFGYRCGGDLTRIDREQSLTCLQVDTVARHWIRSWECLGTRSCSIRRSTVVRGLDRPQHRSAKRGSGRKVC